MSEYSSQISDELNRCIGKGTYLTPQYIDKPIITGRSVDNQLLVLHNICLFWTIVSKIGKKALLCNDDRILKILFSELPAGMDIKYHSNLPDCCWDIPLLFRTDESVAGKIYEIQAPGSGWGDLPLYTKCLSDRGSQLPSYLNSFSERYADYIKRVIMQHKEVKGYPRVFHMTDASSVPYSNRYLMEVVNGLHYWGKDNDVTMKDIDFLISHSVISTTTANYFVTYLEMQKKGEFVFAVQPNLIFDEKAVYLLPFYRYTRELFTDEIRSLFPFTSVIENDGFYLEDDRFITIEEFSKMPSSKRMYYLKYGGPDTNRNWGSRSIYRLNKSDCKKLLNKASDLTNRGEVWLIQKDCSKELGTTVLTDDLKALLKDKKNIKCSAFYGIDTYFGMKVMARRHTKVHGQKDTLVGLGI